VDETTLMHRAQGRGVADVHLLAPKLRTLSPHDTAAAARRNDGWNALERVRLLDLARRA
jgi:hypothetical protein